MPEQESILLEKFRRLSLGDRAAIMATIEHMLQLHGAIAEESRSHHANTPRRRIEVREWDRIIDD